MVANRGRKGVRGVRLATHGVLFEGNRPIRTAIQAAAA